MYAIISKTTGRFLKLDAETYQQQYAYEAPYTASRIVLSDHTYPGTVFTTTSKCVIACLLRDGNYDDITIRNFTDKSFNPDDWEMVKVRREVKKFPPPRKLDDIVNSAVRCAVYRNNGNKKKAAEELGVSLKTIYNRLK